MQSMSNFDLSLINFPPSPVESVMTSESAKGKEREHGTNDIERGPPDDHIGVSDNKPLELRQVSKRRSQYYKDEFAFREPLASPKELVAKESVVTAEIKTNVIVNDEYTFITDLSHQISVRYQRPQSSVLITVVHSTCFLFAGSFEPAYTLTITALPTLVQPMTNRRNASLLSQSLEEALSVPPSRGIIKFIALPAENYACDGMTYAGAIAEIGRKSNDADEAVKRSASRGSKARKRSSMRSLRNLKLNFGGEKKEHDVTPPASVKEVNSPLHIPSDLDHGTATISSLGNDGLTTPLPPMPMEKSNMDKLAEKAQTLGKRRSLMDLIWGSKKT